MSQHSREKVRVGLVGAGFVARIHAEAYRRVYGVAVELRGVAAAHRERAAAFAEEFGVARVYDDAEALLADGEIDLVDVCVPPYLHAPIAIAAARAGKHVIVEKPLTGYFGPAPRPPNNGGFPEPPIIGGPGGISGSGGSSVGALDRATMLRGALANADAMLEAVRGAGVKLCYAENWCYAPPIRKADRLLAASKAAVLRIVGEESHSGTHSEPNKRWVTAGGGSLIGKACHPLGGALFLKYREGLRRDGKPVRPVAVSAEVASFTRMASFAATEPKWLRTGYEDVEDWGTMLVTFDDGSVAQITGADTVLGGIRNQLTVFASNTLVQCNINPNDACLAYTPDPRAFDGEYITEKIETTAGWTHPSPDEDFITGYPAELQDFCEAIACDREPDSGPLLARDTIAIIYGAYLSAERGQRIDLRPYLAPTP
jgi:predicted dehydrogenase